MTKEEASLLIQTMIHGHLSVATKLIHRLEAQELDPEKDWPQQTIHEHLARMEIHPDHRELRAAVLALQSALPLLEKHLG